MGKNPRIDLDSLSVNDFERIQKIGTVINFKKGEEVFIENDISTHIIIVVEGFVKLSKMNNNKNLPIRYIAPMQLIGESVSTKSNRYPLSAHFMTNGSAIKIEYKCFKQVLLWSPVIGLSMFNLVNNTQLHLFKEMENQRKLSITQRVLLFLVNYESLLPQLLKKEIASILFLPPETFSRQLRTLKDRGYISVEKGVIKIN